MFGVLNLTYRFLSYSFPHLGNVSPESPFYVICVVKNGWGGYGKGSFVLRKRLFEGAEGALWQCDKACFVMRNGLFRVTEKWLS